MQKVIGVSFNQLGKVCYYHARGQYQLGDKVVATLQGISLVGTVVMKERELDINLESLDDQIERKATAIDIQHDKENIAKAQTTVEITKQKVKELGLKMKVVDAVYSLDGSKVIIDFTADERVDFRELLKELATKLRTRIELKQIGQRDEVKIKGGIGPCGEICCCKRFLSDFEHVTVKMAKNQGLSLSPTKISGLCGRLMCCLGYENPQYEEILKLMPKINSAVSTPDGDGVAVYNDILRQVVSVKFVRGEETSVEDYPLSKISVISKKENKNGIQNKSK